VGLGVESSRWLWARVRNILWAEGRLSEAEGLMLWYWKQRNSYYAIKTLTWSRPGLLLQMLRNFLGRGTSRFVKQDNKLRYSHLSLCHAGMISALHASRQGGVFEAPSCAPTTLYYALTTTANTPICTLAAKVPQASYPTLHASYIIWDALNGR
jgi:hypothetical protein